MTRRAAVLSTLALAGLMMSGGSSFAHPHVWTMMKSEIVFAPDGSMTKVRHAWTFDDMFSAFATMGIETKIRGEFTREDLHPLAQINVESLKEFDYFTYARVNGSRNKELFNAPVDYWLDYDKKASELTLHFTLPFRSPVRPKNLDLQVYDPQFFVYFEFAERNPVKLVGAPPQCKANVVRSNNGEFSQSMRWLFTSSEVNAGMGSRHAHKINVKCP